MPYRSVITLAMVVAILIFAYSIRVPDQTFVQELPFATKAQKYSNGYSVLLNSADDFQGLGSHGCDANVLRIHTIQYQKGYHGTNTKSPCANSNYILSSSKASSPVISRMTNNSPNQPVITDPNLRVETVFKGSKFSSSMAFLAPNDILVLQKNNGTVERIMNGKVAAKPLLRVNVSTEGERGMLGIAVTRTKNSSSTQPITYVFLYFTQQHPLANRLYRYELVNNESLVNPKLLLSIPAGSAPYHNGGRMIIGPDNNIYITTGDLFRHRTKSQNFKNGTDPDGTGGILRMTQDGKPVGKGVLGNKYPLNLYYAYGIRNSFGIDFDPVTKKLWDTENGPNFGDEINLVEPGFNSGWNQVQGIWKPVDAFPPQDKGPIVIHPQANLEDFGGKGNYRAPELTWNQTVGPTALKFLNSTKLGKQYQNDMFVADFNKGNLYRFELNEQRNGLLVNDSIPDNIMYNNALEQPANWIDPSANCKKNFKCTMNFTAGWQNIKTSYQVSATDAKGNTWSRIVGKEIAVKPNENYDIVTHMKLNEFATKSHIAIEGYNVTSKKWQQIMQCPIGTNGPLEWHEYSCEMTIPKDTVKIRPVLNAGWSSQPGKEAITLFDAINIFQTIGPTSNNNLVSNPNFAQWMRFGYGFGHITDLQIGPDGYLYILSIRAKDPYSDPVKGTIYRIIPISN